MRGDSRVQKVRSESYKVRGLNSSVKPVADEEGTLCLPSQGLVWGVNVAVGNAAGDPDHEHVQSTQSQQRAA